MFHMFIQCSVCHYISITSISKDLQDRQCINPLSANPTKWSNTLKRFIGCQPKNCLSVFDLFVGLALKSLRDFGALFGKLIDKHERI